MVDTDLIGMLGRGQIAGKGVEPHQRAGVFLRKGFEVAQEHDGPDRPGVVPRRLQPGRQTAQSPLIPVAQFLAVGDYPLVIVSGPR